MRMRMRMRIRIRIISNSNSKCIDITLVNGYELICLMNGMELLLTFIYKVK